MGFDRPRHIEATGWLSAIIGTSLSCVEVPMQDQPNQIAPVVKPLSLAHMVMTGDAETLEDMMREMLRPMLSAWLDDNLPSMVERLVRDEIERLKRGQ